MNNVIDWLKQYWFIFSALIAGGVAWGQTTMQVTELKEKVAKTEATVRDQSRIDERTLIMQQEMKEQKQILIELLTTQRALAQKNKIVIPEQNRSEQK